MMSAPRFSYYNEFDPYAAAWLRNLISAGHIAPGEVDERSIEDVSADELSGFAQCHFFAGIGVWSYALRRAGWEDDRPVWTGSCPCPPFSAAGKGSECPSCGGKSCLSHPLVTAGWVCLDCGDEWRGDDRHLLPEFIRLWGQCRPSDVFGEQVASRDGVLWLHTLRSTVELGGYALGAADMPSAGFGAPHIRQRLMFGSYRMADAVGGDAQQLARKGAGSSDAEGWRASGRAAGCSDARGLGVTVGAGLEGHGRHGDDGREPGRVRAEPGRSASEASRGSGGLADPYGDGLSEDGKRRAEEERHGAAGDGAARRLAVAAGTRGGAGPQSSGARDDGRRGVAGRQVAHGGLAHADGFDGDGAGSGAGADGGRVGESTGLLGGAALLGHNGGPGPTNGVWRDADWLFCRDGKWRPVEPGTFPLAHGAPARVGRLRAYGNAINAIQAQAFIAAFMECRP